MKDKDIIRLFRLMEDLNDHFHQSLNYTNPEKSAEMAKKNYSEIKDFYYNIIWDILPNDFKKQIEEE
ncbi:hypothetical protein [Tenacibaculum maritimum]|uniref:Uncharacterized protein n=1 Tax=Tenacibaculum maritimum NCIMB 2154 TaxID=1349785 RepID=A0A2H1EDR2_9FLAO|nr:hypothetical protein [Tenacibaculum maritimum]MCD9562545.1 hypothetical protein [Tenacibaculum maritimum]MCD9565973.1 hypothetical protein [Tenacibaculum maritimum]MCD9577716.1 hypothetical protein [Tenacibaculum maritimum]MCD9597886.1 hypothetical protein [Tenacibaculum maritimum]MCD9613497.1 hypothetical protein [Tenacibaculum maritimum]